MDTETMKQWNALIVEYNERTAKINIEFSNKRKELEDEHRKAKAELEQRKHDFIYKMKLEQNAMSQKYIDAYREVVEKKCDAKRAVEAERQAAYLKFKLEHNISEDKELTLSKAKDNTKPIKRKSRKQRWLTAINKWLRPNSYEEA